MNEQIILYRAGGAADAVRSIDAPVGVLVRFADAPERPLGCEILAVGPPDEVAAHEAAGAAETIDLGDHTVITPAFVNTHTHLDLTSVGPQPYDKAAGFAGWLKMVLRSRPTEPAAIAASVAQGVERLLAGGVVAVGDIAGAMRTEPIDALRTSNLLGVGYLEFFGLGDAAPASVQRIHDAVEVDRVGDGADARIRFGLSPHAPYSAGIDVYRACADEATEQNVPVCTHAAESLAERRLIRDGEGPMLDLLQQMGMCEDAAKERFGEGQSSLQRVLAMLGEAPALLAHVGDVDDADIERLARSNCSVVYCPRSRQYFGHDQDLGPHRWRDMRDAGVEVALGTDSIINLPAADDGALPDLGVLAEARDIARTEAVDPRDLLAMATTAGARVLGLNPEWFTLAPGPVAGLCSVDVRAVAAHSHSAQRVISAKSPAVLLKKQAKHANVVSTK
jgi:cytosine/adenosine deaminase-related metal-dependent hydrolase